MVSSNLLSHRVQFSVLLVITMTFSLIAEPESAEASIPQKAASLTRLVASSDPHLVCVETGELSGEHPGWVDDAAQKITLVPLDNSNFGVYWCPAAAPNGYGQISYTLTSALGAITCETIALSCVMLGISKSSKLSLTATDQTGTSGSEPIAIPNSGVPSYCVKVQLGCSPGPTTRNYPTYGNTSPAGVGDCTFAAVANWELITLGVHSEQSQLIGEYKSAAGSNNLNLTDFQVFNYWNAHGIGGIYAKTWKALSTDPLTVKKLLDSSKTSALIASINLAQNQNFAGTTTPDPAHLWVVADGYTPQGPLVVVWGKTLQMTWQQWNLESANLWQISALGSS